MVQFANLLDRTCSIYRRTLSGRDIFNDRDESFEIVYSNVPCRRQPSEATDNIPLNIGDGEQLRIQQIFWFLPDQDIDIHDELFLNDRSDNTTLQETGERFKVLAVDGYDMVNRVHHKRVEASKIFS